MESPPSEIKIKKTCSTVVKSNIIYLEVYIFTVNNLYDRQKCCISFNQSLDVHKNAA